MIEVQECVRGHRMRPTALDPEPPPAIAEVGLLCRPCFQRLAWRLAEAPDVLARLRHQVVPQAAVAGGGGPRVSGTRELPIPLNAHALELGDQLYSALLNWATSVARTMGVRPPAMLQPYLDGDVDVVSAPAALGALQAASAVTPVVQWLEDQLESIAYLPFAGDLHDDVVELVARGKTSTGLLARRKIRQRPRPCALCSEVAVEVSWDGEWPVVSCRSCGHRIAVEWELVS